MDRFPILPAAHGAAARAGTTFAGASGDSVAARWSRRVVTVPAYLLGAALALALLPFALALTIALDAGPRGLAWRGARDLARAPRTRFVIGITFVLLCEAAGLAGALFDWISCAGGFGRARARLQRLDRKLQRWWARALLHRGRRILGLGLRVVAGPGLLDEGPVLVLARHASLVDSLLPCVLLDRFRLRYVLKRELLWDPCLDIVGNRLPNAFVRRGESRRGAHPTSARNLGAEDGAGDSAEIARVAALARDLGSDDGVVLFPEGTRFTSERRQDLLDRFEARGDGARPREAGTLRHVLPPRRGGVLALLDAAPGADVIVLAHTGLEGAARLGDLWRGSLHGQTLEVEMWRVPRREIPADTIGRDAWLAETWHRVDRWIERRRGSLGGDGVAT